MTTLDRFETGRQATEDREIVPVALPEPGMSMEQDTEWCVVNVDDEWRQIRFHDYDEVYRVPGLYERVFYDVLKCNSPATVCRLLHSELRRQDRAPATLRVFDVGAGNGMVGEELVEMGVATVVGADIIEEARMAAERDRPEVYEEYVVTDLANISDRERALLQTFEFNCLTCVAALGFGDIPPEAFTEAYNLVEDGGFVAFNIKETFLDKNDTSGFSTLIREMMDREVLAVQAQKRYQHRLATNGDPLYYVAVVGQKRKDVAFEVGAN